MRIGQLRERIQVQRETRTDDGIGGYVKTWSTFAEISSQWTYTGGGDTDEEQQTTTRRVFDVKIRTRSDISRAHRFLRGSKYFGIIGINDSSEQQNFLLVTVEELPVEVPSA